jgi:alpha-amylase
MRKGFDGSQVITVLTNKGEASSDQILNLKKTGFTGGEKVMEVLTCKEQTVRPDGSIDVKIHKGLPNVFYPAAGLKGSKICQTASPPSPSGMPSSAVSPIKTFSQGSIPVFLIGVSFFCIPPILW